MNKQVILDASALLAYLQNENGCEKIEEALTKGSAIISAVNYAEVVRQIA